MPIIRAGQGPVSRCPAQVAPDGEVVGRATWHSSEGEVIGVAASGAQPAGAYTALGAGFGATTGGGQRIELRGEDSAMSPCRGAGRTDRVRRSV